MNIRSHGSLRDQAILKLKINAGLRVGETCGLKITVIELTPKSITIKVGTGEEQRSFSMQIYTRKVYFYD